MCFVERHSFRIVTGELAETMRKLCLSTKFHTRKLGEITILFVVKINSSNRNDNKIVIVMVILISVVNEHEYDKLWRSKKYCNYACMIITKLKCVDQTIFQKQPPEVFYKKLFLPNKRTTSFQRLLDVYTTSSIQLHNIHRKTPVLESLLKKRLQDSCFTGTIAKYLRTPILKNICERLLLMFPNSS